MHDMIYRQAAIDLWVWGDTDMRAHSRVVHVEDIEALPSAQPEIIRCKDCKNWDTTWTNDFVPNYHYCPMVDGVRKSDFYCADAERRPDE